MTSNRISGDTWPYSHTNDLHGSGWIGHAAGISAGIIPQVTAVHPDGRRLLRIEAKNAETPIERKPGWIRTTARTGPNYQDLQQIVQKADLHTVCREANCPNIFEYDPAEPMRVAASVKKMGLRYATVTGVCRDDLPDQGAWLYAETIRQIHAVNPGVGVEMLAPDFSAKEELVSQVLDTRPEVFAHNVETVPRIFKRIRPAFRYDRSLDVLRMSRDAGLVTKSNLILGMGETREEVSQALADLYDAGTELITITQYLRPNATLHPISRWVPPEEFDELAEEAKQIGYSGVLSGPLVRSSYRAGRLYRTAMEERKKAARKAGSK